MSTRHSRRRGCIARSATTLQLERLEPRRLLSAVPVGPEFQANTYTLGNQGAGSLGGPSVAADADGDFVIAWSSPEPDGFDYGIYAQRYNALGVPQGSEFRVNTYTTNDQLVPSAAMDADGDFVITWQSLEQDGSSWGVYGQRYTADGAPAGGEFGVNSYTTSDQWFSSAAMAADGSFVVAWRSFGQDGAEWEMYARRYDAAGAPQGGEFRANSFTTGTQTAGSVGINANGDFVIAWHSVGQDGDGNGVYAKRYNAAGVPQGGEFPVNTYTTGSQAQPSVGLSADGDFVIAWLDNGQDGSGFGVYAQRFDAAGVPQGAEFRANTYTAGSQRVPPGGVAVDADGDFVITWDSEQQDGSGIGAYARQYRADGLPQGSEFRVNTYTTGNQRRPLIATDGQGDFIICWSSAGQDGSGEGVFAQRFALEPEVTASSFLLDTAPQRLRFTFNHNVMPSLGTNDLVVENLTTSQTIPSTHFSLSYDSATNTATFSYTGNASGITGVLPDGNYRATLLAAGITNPAGTPLAQDHLFNFLFMNGDADRDADVDLDDFNILASNFNTSGKTFSQGNFSYDAAGNVNLDDFNILAGRFGSLLAPDETPTSSPFSPIPIASGQTEFRRRLIGLLDDVLF